MAPKVVTGGSRVGNEGYFIAPTVLTDTKPEMSVVRGGDLRARSYAR
jgi:acyl-CoA reductase-like NAD-dependent aldehyde dehydrogenase